MKTRANLGLVISTMLILLMLCPAAAKADLSNGLVAHWKFDEGTGSTAYDSAGTNDGTLFGNTTWVTGQIGSGALDFDGNGDYVDVGTMGSFGGSIDNGTISAWVKSDVTNTPMSVFGVVNTTPISLRTQVRIDLNHNPYDDVIPGQIYLLLRDEDGKRLAAYVNSNTGVTNGSWHHVVVVFYASTNTVKVYLDSSAQIVSYKRKESPVNFVDLDRTAYIGACHASAGAILPFDGSIDDVRIYNRALSAEEIEQLYAGEPNPMDVAIDQIQQALIEKVEALDTIDAALEKEQAAYELLEQILESGEYCDLKKGDIVKAGQKVHSATQHQDQAKHQIDKSIEKLKDSLESLGYELPQPIAHWTFDEGSGNIAHDSAGSNHGTLYGDTAWVASQVGTGALDFDGDVDYVEIADDDSLTPSSEITIAFWLFNRAEQPAGIYKYASCPSQPYSPGNSRAYLMTVYDSSGKASLKVYSSTDNYGRITSNNVVPLNEWHHLVATFDQGNAAIYIDGQLDNSATLSVSSIMNDAQPLIIGGFWDYCGTDAFHTSLNGMMDDVRVYDRALSDIEVQLLYYNVLD